MTAKDAEDFAPPPGADEVTLPEPPGGYRAVSDDSAGDSAEARSLFEDVEMLIEDGKTYLEAELNYQKTRAIYVADRAKAAVVFGAIAGALAFLALIGLTLGLIIALTPLLTAWGASAVVVGLLALGALLSGRAAARRWNRLMDALGSGDGNAR